jgi:neutral ceramidase
MRMSTVLVLCAVSLCPVAVSTAVPLRTGAARVDITPPADAALPMAGYGGRTQGFKGIHDRIYVRAIVLDDGVTRAAIVVWESLFVPDVVWAMTSKRIADETGIRPEHLLLSAVHGND